MKKIFKDVVRPTEVMRIFYRSFGFVFIFHFSNLGFILDGNKDPFLEKFWRTTARTSVTHFIQFYIEKMSHL